MINKNLRTPVVKNKIQLSIVVVDYKSGIYLERLRKSLPKRSDWELIVIDNAIQNRGFGGGCNEGMRRARGTYVFFLNPDVSMEESAIEILLSYLKMHPNVGVVGPKYINAEGKTEQCSTQHPTPFVASIAFSFLNTVFPKNVISTQYWISNWDRESTRQIDVVSGAAMMVRADEFRDIGMFDTSYFLYWEEFDLCKRYAQIGLQSAYVAEAIAYHPRHVSMQRSTQDLSHIFRESRYRYFQKFFGVIPALLLELWLLFTRQWRVVLIALWSFLLRTGDLSHLKLIGDVGRDYLQAYNLLHLTSFPLLGIPSSIPRFFQGPLNVWFTALSFLFGGVNPFSPVLFSAAVTTLGVIALYFLIEKQFGKTAAFAAGIVAAVAPGAVHQSRMPFYLFAVPLFFTLYLSRLLRLRVPSFKTIALSVLSFWLLFQWELAAMPFIFLLGVSAYIGRANLKQWIAPTIFGTLIGLLPQLIYDLTHRCSQICGVIAWAGYRVVAISGFDGRHAFSQDSMSHIAIRMSEEFERLFGLGNYSIVVALVLTLIGATIWWKNRRSSHLLLLSLSGLLLLMIGIVLHGDPSEAYFPPFLVLIPIFISAMVFSVSNTYKKVLVILCIGYACMQSSLQIQNHFYAPNISAQIEAAHWIVSDAQERAIRLKSYDAPAQTPSYLDHYKILILMFGGNLQTQSDFPSRSYVVSQDDEIILPTTNVMMQRFDYVRVARSL